MDVEFHYWITGIIASYSGFSNDDAKIIAYSSQYVDDNSIGFMIDKKGIDSFPVLISQTIDMTKPRDTFMRIYPLFHLVPGDPVQGAAVRKDHAYNPFVTTANSENANKIMDMGLESNNMYRIGIATHAYADSWAHQNFTGLKDNFNGMAGNPLPNIAHADVLQEPDKVGHTWTDSRLINSRINNNQRFMEAAEQIFQKFITYNTKKHGTPPTDTWNAPQTILSAIMNKHNIKRRMADYKKLMPWMSDYHWLDWFYSAVRVNVRGLNDLDDYRIPDLGPFLSKLTFFKDSYYWNNASAYRDTNWYKFQTAVKDHAHSALQIIASACNTMGIVPGVTKNF